MTKYKVSMTLDNKIKWLGRFFNVSINKYIDWNVRTMEEDGGAWDRVHKTAKTLEEAIDSMWVARKMDKKLESVLAYRDENYRDDSDKELGIAALNEKGDAGK